MSTVERWVMVNRDGSLTLVTENDGEVVAYRGVEHRESPTTLSEIQNQYPQKIYDDAVDSIKQALVHRNKHLLRLNNKEIDIRRHLQPNELEEYLKLVSCKMPLNTTDQKRYSELCSLIDARYQTAVTEIDEQMK
jgi:hypothetical protein